MSTEDQAGAGRREVAYRVFAAEYDDADFEYTENEDDERAPNYVVTPTGARVNRLFAAGVLTEVERVNEEMLRGRVVDPTGAFVVYAGQYQPDPLTALERADPPTFVAVTGKARTFQPEDADVIYTSIRPESINEVDADTRDRWTVDAARHTLDRVATFADALEREERGDELRAALEAAGVDSGLAAGVPLAIQHYGTTTAYLDAVREVAVQAAEVVAGEREEVDPLDLAPDEGGDASFAATSGTETPTGAESPVEAGTATADDSGESEEPAAATDEMYEFDDDEREEIEEEYGTEFSTGSEIDGPGEADLDTPAPEDAETADVGEETTAADQEEAAADVDLEEAVVETMRELDSGDGAERAAVVETVSEAHGVDEDEVADAIQDALMSGKCYEPGDGLLKAI